MRNNNGYKKRITPNNLITEIPAVSKDPSRENELFDFLATIDWSKISVPIYMDKSIVFPNSNQNTIGGIKVGHIFSFDRDTCQFKLMIVGKFIDAAQTLTEPVIECFFNVKDDVITRVTSLLLRAYEEDEEEDDNDTEEAVTYNE